MTQTVRKLWVLVFLVALANSVGAATAQERAIAPDVKPTAAKPAGPTAEPPATETPPAAPTPDEPAQPPAAESQLEPGVVRLLMRQHDALGRRCELQHSARSGTLRFLACGNTGMWIVRLSNEAGENAVLVTQQDLGGKVQRFFQADGRLWVEINSVRAQEIGVGSALIASQPEHAAEAPMPAAPNHVPPSNAAPRPEPARGKVISQTNEELLVELDEAIAKPREHIALIGAGRYQDGEQSDQQIFAVGEVTRSWLDGRARVAIGMNESVPLTAAARASSAPLTASVFAPPRAAGVWEIGFLARPFLVLENLGVGAMLDGYVSYRAQAPFHVQASLTPLALALARGGNYGATGAFVSGSYDSRLFEVGLGVGAQTVNKPSFALNPGSGMLFAQELRIGARDGAHLRFLSYVALFHSNFEFSSLRVEAQVPVGARTWLRLAGGGGSLGLNFGEVGLRVLMSGNGGADSFFLTTVAGWTNLYYSCNDVPQIGGAAATSCKSADYAGPTIGAGGEWRL